MYNILLWFDDHFKTIFENECLQKIHVRVYVKLGNFHARITMKMYLQRKRKTCKKCSLRPRCKQTTGRCRKLFNLYQFIIFLNILSCTIDGFIEDSQHQLRVLSTSKISSRIAKRLYGIKSADCNHVVNNWQL